MTSPLIGIESVMGESALAITKGYTGTPDQATGYAATFLADESPANEWRTTDTDRDSSRALVRWGRKRYLRTIAGWEHNLGRHALWRWTADDEYAIRPAWDSDGIDDAGSTAATIPSAADFTLYLRLWLRPQAVGVNTTNAELLRIDNGSGTVRFRVQIRHGAGANPWQLNCLWYNFQGAVQTQLIPATPLPDGKPHDLVFRYRDSDKLCEILLDGTSVASGTATLGFLASGTERLYISRVGVVQAARATWQDIRYYNAYHADSTVQAYRAAITSGIEASLAGAWHFAEGTGTTVADSTGASPLTLTGGTWVERVNPSPRWSTGTLEVREQWRRRQAIDLTAGAYVSSPVLGAAERSITLSALMLVPSDAELVASSALWYGPSIGDAELRFYVNTGGALVLESFRRAAGVLRITGPVISDGVLRRARAVLDGRNKAMSLYIATDGDAAETLIETATGLDAYGTLASCVLGVGNSVLATPFWVSDVRLYSEIRLEADDPLARNVAPTDPELLAQIRLDDSVNDVVVPSRVYTESVSPAPTYAEISQTATRVLPAADARRVDAAADPYTREQPLLVAFAAATVEAVEGYLEIWDPDNSDGYVRLAALLPQDAFEPLLGRGWGLDRRASRRPARRTVDGLIYRERGYDTDALVLRLPSVRTFGNAADVADTDASEADELLARLRRNPRERLVTVIGSPWVAQHRLAAHTVVGVATEEQAITDPAYGISSTEITVESVRRPPSS